MFQVKLGLLGLFWAGILTGSILSAEEKRPLDLLVVLDNSGSMQEEHSLLAKSFTHFVADISHLDWRIGVITTEYNCLQGPFIAADDPLAGEKFAKAVQLETFGSGIEVGIQMAAENLELIESSGCPQWRRANAKLAILFVSDEDESVSGMPFYRFLTYAEDKGYELGYNLRVYAMTGLPTSTCMNLGGVGHSYLRLAEYTSGKAADICQPDWQEAMRLFSANLRLFGG